MTNPPIVFGRFGVPLPPCRERRIRPASVGSGKHPRRTPNLPNTIGGFTLIEVLLAVVVVGLAFVILSQGMGTAAQTTSLSQKRMRAAYLASQKMVEVEAGAIDPARQNDQGTFPEPDEDFSYLMTAETTAQTTVYSVTVKVSWGEGDGENIVLTRLINTALRTKP